MPLLFIFFFNDTATTEIYTLSLHDALPISPRRPSRTPPSRASLAGLLRFSLGLGLGRFRGRLHVAQPVPRGPRRLELPPEGVEPILVEQEVAAVRRGEIERLQHDDRVGRTHLHAQLAELARVELEREDLRVVPLGSLEHLDLDDLGRADVLAEPAANAILLAGLGVVGEREDPAEAVGVRPLDVGIVDRHRLAEEIPQRDTHRPADGADELYRLPPEPQRGPAAVRSHWHLAWRSRTRSRAGARASRAAGASRRSRGSGPRGSERRTSAPT